MRAPQPQPLSSFLPPAHNYLPTQQTLLSFLAPRMGFHTHASGSHLQLSPLGVSPQSHTLCHHSHTPPTADGRTQALAPDPSCPHTLPGLELAAFFELSYDILAQGPSPAPHPHPSISTQHYYFQTRVLRVTHVSPSSVLRTALPTPCTDGETGSERGRTVKAGDRAGLAGPISPPLSWGSAPEVCVWGCEVSVVCRREDQTTRQETGVCIPLLTAT